MNQQKSAIKSDLRKTAEQKRSHLSSKYKTHADKEIVIKILDLPEYIKAKFIFIFVGVKDEIDTKPLIEASLAAGKTVAVPKCKKNSVMDAVVIKSLNDLKSGYFGLLEPIDSSHILMPSEIDFAIIPCLSCDTRGNRLGYGGGYYDRYLSGAAFPYAVVCRDESISESIPTESFDIQSPIVITETKLLRITI